MFTESKIEYFARPEFFQITMNLVSLIDLRKVELQYNGIVFWYTDKTSEFIMIPDDNAKREYFEDLINILTISQVETN